MTGSTRRDPRVSDLLAEHQELMQKITDICAFRGEVCELGVGPKCIEMADQVADIRRLLEHHFDVEEDGGYMRNVLAVAPQFTEQAMELCAQHAEFLQTLDDLEVRLRTPESDVCITVCGDFDTFISDLQDHEHRENNLIQQAFNQDDGAGD